MTSLESTASHLSTRMSNPQGSLLSGKATVNGSGNQHHLSSHQPASSSSSSSASIFDAFAPIPGGPTSAQAGSNNNSNGASNNGPPQSGGHRQSASMNLPASMKSPVVGGPSSTSPSAASAFDALASQFANASLGPNSSVPSGQRHQSMHEHQSISPAPHYAQPVYPGHPGHRAHVAHHPGYHPHPRHSSQQPHHNPNPAVSTMWPRRHGVVKFFNSTKGELGSTEFLCASV